MNLETYVANEKINVKWIDKIPNKTIKKYINRFKFVEVQIHWYDNEKNPNENTWVDVEGIGYGWMWLNHKDSKRLQRKAIIAYAMALYRDSVGKICTVGSNDTTLIYMESRQRDSIMVIKVSNNELFGW